MGESFYRSKLLLDEKEKNEEKDRKLRGILKHGSEKVEYDDLDFNILKILSLNARIPTIEIAKKLNTTAQTINNRIKKLISSEIILDFRVALNMKKFGYNFFKVDLFLSEHKKVPHIVRYIESNQHLYAIDYTLGYADLELELILKNVDHLHHIIEDISVNFPKIIKNYKYSSAVEMHKYSVL
jgi:DNA-binding Lrp family transcriptional regulator